MGAGAGQKKRCEEVGSSPGFVTSDYVILANGIHPLDLHFLVFKMMY